MTTLDANPFARVWEFLRALPGTRLRCKSMSVLRLITSQAGGFVTGTRKGRRTATGVCGFGGFGGFRGFMIFRIYVVSNGLIGFDAKFYFSRREPINEGLPLVPAIACLIGEEDWESDQVACLK